MQKLDLLKEALAGHFSNEAKTGEKFIKISRLEFYREDIIFFYNLAEEHNLGLLIKRSGKGVTAILSILD